jgi:diacylglycerol O-acyltransferase
MRELGALAGGWRDDPALHFTDTLAAVLDRLPAVATTSLFGSMLKGVDLVATNIPGLSEPAYLAGAEVVREYAFGPPSGAAFSAALLSHLDQCCIGINADTVAVPDPDVLSDCIRAGFDEVLTVGGRS